MIDREAIYEALFQRLQEQLAGEVKYFTRRLDHWENINSQPALLLVADNQRAEQQFGLPPIWTLAAEIYLYLVSSKSDQTPESSIHALVDKLELALQRGVEPNALEWGVRLAGLVDSISLTSVEVAQGEEAGQAVAVVRLEMVAAST